MLLVNTATVHIVFLLHSLVHFIFEFDLLMVEILREESDEITSLPLITWKAESTVVHSDFLKALTNNRILNLKLNSDIWTTWSLFFAKNESQNQFDLFKSSEKAKSME